MKTQDYVVIALLVAVGAGVVYVTTRPAVPLPGPALQAPVPMPVTTKPEDLGSRIGGLVSTGADVLSDLIKLF